MYDTWGMIVRVSIMSDERSENDFSKDDGTGKAAEPEESFSALLEKSSSLAGRLQPGQKVKARVISISGDFVYLDLGGKSDGVVELKEFTDDEGSLPVRAGDEIEAYFVSAQDGTKVLTTRVRGYSAIRLNGIRGAFEAGLPVNGEVKREVKGGFEISVSGVRCFCPFSQIDLRGGREGGIYLGQAFPFKVLEYEEDGRNIVVSRRALLEQDRQERINRLQETLVVGMEVSGTVRSLQNFGAFMDLGGIDGLIPVSEISWERTGKPEDLLSIGQAVTAKIIALDWEGKRITLSLKALQPDPWFAAAEKYPVDSRVSGMIVRLAPFGAFVNLEAGVDGLIHISNLGAGRRINHPKEVVEVGQFIEAYVLEVNQQNRRISLSIQPKMKPEKIIFPEVGELVGGVVERVMPYGIFVKMPTGLTGLIPKTEIGTPGGTDHNRMFPPGTEVKVVVIDVDTDQGKVRLSRKSVLERVEQEEFEQYKNSQKRRQVSSSGFGSLGEMLKAKMEEKGTIS
ncbi:MAG TPA: 30S ribosomal protein S1 [Nitrospiraceae bacterium]|jgi:small subunit ribosomal protein S1|nr:30S ribosomal protein S1 [Nitrospiraceae bacterium]